MIHMPVPRGRSDEAYFEPLKRLSLKPQTQLCLGLVHYTDGVAGTRARLATAKKYAQGFSIDLIGFTAGDQLYMDVSRKAVVLAQQLQHLNQIVHDLTGRPGMPVVMNSPSHHPR